MEATEQEVLTSDLRTTLKQVFVKEIQNIPEYLENLPPKEKMDYLLKLMPYVFPKVNSVNSDDGEPFILR